MQAHLFALEIAQNVSKSKLVRRGALEAEKSSFLGTPQVSREMSTQLLLSLIL